MLQVAHFPFHPGARDLRQRILLLLRHEGARSLHRRAIVFDWGGGTRLELGQTVVVLDQLDVSGRLAGGRQIQVHQEQQSQHLYASQQLAIHAGTAPLVHIIHNVIVVLQGAPVIPTLATRLGASFQIVNLMGGRGEAAGAVQLPLQLLQLPENGRLEDAAVDGPLCGPMVAVKSPLPEPGVPGARMQPSGFVVCPKKGSGCPQIGLRFALRRSAIGFALGIADVAHGRVLQDARLLEAVGQPLEVRLNIAHAGRKASAERRENTDY